MASPLAPDDALKHFQVEAGLTVELVACEPEVIDPIAMRFDEDGRLWVIEMRDYPHGPRAGEHPASTIRVLEDRDGDGRFETSQVFADRLLFPTGLQPWRGGVIVTLAGQVVYMKDSDGDGRRDVEEVWFRGFAQENPQLRANHPRFGLDHRVYVAGGLRGGAIVDPRQREKKPLSISGMDFRFDPQNGHAEAVAGNGQFGLTFDDFGNRFVCNNRAPLDHVVMENQYVARNPFLAVPALVASVAAAGEQSRVFPLVSAWTTSNLHAGQFTAACGVEIYRDAVLGDAFRGNAFVCEPTGSLVHREALRAQGVSFVSMAIPEGKEFLASRDPWFRPVNLEIGPDGALYVVDMYRAVIEHPQFMPAELQERPDMRLGDDRGRIYRVVRSGTKAKRQAPRLSTASSAELVALLRHPIAWWRDTAGRLLYERQDMTAARPLAQLAASAPEPVARIAALWALDGLKSLSADVIGDRLSDGNPRVREQAVALAEPRLADNESLRRGVLALAGDSDDRVRFRAALAIGGLKGTDVVEALSTIALAQPNDAWTRRAVCTALPETTAALLGRTLASPRGQQTDAASAETSLVRELAAIFGSRHAEQEITAALEAIVEASDSRLARESALAGLAVGLERRAKSLSDFVAHSANSALQSKLAELFARVTAAALDESLPEDARAAKIELLRYAGTPEAGDALEHVVLADASQRLRVLAADALAPYGGKHAQALLAGYATQTPLVRRAILDALIAPRDSAAALLDALESRAIVRAELDATRENALRRHGEAAIAERAKRILVASVPAERKKVLTDYQPAVQLQGDPTAGRELFRKNCAQCHRIGEIGVNVAPDISDSRTKTPEQLLVDILNPNQAIDNNYISYTIATTQGTVHTGVIAAETASSITLRQPENKSLVLLRADIERIDSNGVSLMPEGLERDLTQRQMADLISFVKNWRYLDQSIPGTIGGQDR